MRILLLGSSGQLGWEAQRSLAPLGEIVGPDGTRLDFTRPHELYRRVVELHPQVIYNAAAYTAVDRAESEPEQARLVNAVSAGMLAEAARKIGAVLIHFSTDYVFDGQQDCPYVETDPPNPLNVYGATKLEGEQAIQTVDGAYLILRTAWLYSDRRESFVSKVLAWSKERSAIRVVTDQISSPTWARMLAETTALLLARGGADLSGWVRERRGIYHLAGEGSASRFAWAKAILASRPPGTPPVEVLPALTAEFPSPAVRPRFSALNCEQFYNVFQLRLPPWQQALRLAMQQSAQAGLG